MIIRNGNCILEAHRGVSSDYPENTLAAYRAAVDLGCGMIELDARFTMDNRCVMMHDRTLSRTTRLPDGITSWCKTPPVTPETAQRIHEIGRLGIWLLTEQEEYDIAGHTLHADVVETDGRLRP